jgi:CSLREA domain-containing protein
MTASEYRTRSISTALCLLAAALAGTFVVLMAVRADRAKAAVPGTTITVNTKEDESNSKGDCSLREAIRAANSNSAVDGCKTGSATKRDAIRFRLGRFHLGRFHLGKRATIVLVSQLPTITDASGLTINGGRNARIVVSGDGKVRVFSVSKDARLALANLTVADGFADTAHHGTGTGGVPGGGIANRGGTLTVTHSTFSGNNAVLGGGAIANLAGGTLRVIDSTFYANRSTFGSGILNDRGRLKVSYSTFSTNDAEFYGAILNANSKAATTRLSSTVLADNLNDNIVNVCAGADLSRCRGTITDGGYNISDDRSFRFTDPHSKSSTDPKLDPGGLQSNGGPTKTIALQKGSRAVDYVPRGENGCGTIVKTDQRWVQRPQGKRCDSGAYELEAQPGK